MRLPIAGAYRSRAAAQAGVCHLGSSRFPLLVLKQPGLQAVERGEWPARSVSGKRIRTANQRGDRPSTTNSCPALHHSEAHHRPMAALPHTHDNHRPPR